MNVKRAEHNAHGSHNPRKREQNDKWNKPGYCLNKLSTVELSQLRTISGAASMPFRVLVLHQNSPWHTDCSLVERLMGSAEILTRWLMQQAAISAQRFRKAVGSERRERGGVAALDPLHQFVR